MATPENAFNMFECWFIFNTPPAQKLNTFIEQLGLPINQTIAGNSSYTPAPELPNIGLAHIELTTLERATDAIDDRWNIQTIHLEHNEQTRIGWATHLTPEEHKELNQIRHEAKKLWLRTTTHNFGRKATND